MSGKRTVGRSTLKQARRIFADGSRLLSRSGQGRIQPPVGCAQVQRQRRLLAAGRRMNGRTSIIALARYRYGSDVTLLDARRGIV